MRLMSDTNYLSLAVLFPFCIYVFWLCEAGGNNYVNCFQLFLSFHILKITLS